MGQAKDRQNRREAKKAKRKLNHKAHVKAKNVEKNSSDKNQLHAPTPRATGSKHPHRHLMRG